MKILIIEDDAKIASLITASLAAEGFGITIEPDGHSGLVSALQHNFSAIVLDLGLPVLDGFNVLQQLRNAGVMTPVIILSARSDLENKLKGFELGAHDFLAKPFHIEELRVRLRLAISVGTKQTATTLCQSGITLNLITRQAQWGNAQVTLSQKEFELLEYLMQSPGQIFTKEKILNHVWKIDFDTNTNIVEVGIQRLKKKLSRHNEANVELFPIQNIRGIGYRLIKRII
jgi:DNA-binding response OmpR family regulator